MGTIETQKLGDMIEINHKISTPSKSNRKPSKYLKVVEQKKENKPSPSKQGIKFFGKNAKSPVKNFI